MNAETATITLCIAAAAGVVLVTLADRLRVPMIALLLVGGILLGPQVLGWVDPAALGDSLETIVAIAVAVILFEGGLTLDLASFRREGRVIARMLTLGVLVTWVGTALTIYVAFDLRPETAIIAGSLVIVTGPTVISPLLRRMSISPRLHHVLYTEGVLVDAVGVFVAVLCFEWIESSRDASALIPLGRFASRFFIGAGVGFASGFLLTTAVGRRWIPADHTNIAALGAAMLAFGAANFVLPEAGILAVIVAGFTVSILGAGELRGVRQFKLELTELGIAVLFVLLAAKLEIGQFLRGGLPLVVTLVVVLLLVRPMNILVVTWGQGFNWREKAFLSWVAPRGIVAASMASLLTIRLDERGFPGAHYLETITYAVIGTTVILQGMSAPLLARLLDLKRPTVGPWLFAGDAVIGMALHRALRRAGAPSVVLGDAGGSDPADEAALPDARLASARAVVALAPDGSANASILSTWADRVGASSSYVWGEAGGVDLGVPIWRELPRPGEVRVGLERGYLAVDAVRVGSKQEAGRFSESFRPLLTVINGQIVQPGRGNLGEARWAVVLRERVPKLRGLVRDAIVVDRSTATFDDVVRKLLDVASQSIESLDVAATAAELADREKTMPSSLGGSVAVPHIYSDGVESSACFVANVVGGVEATTPDDQPIRLVFLVVSPAAKPQSHLESLAAIARIASDRGLVDALTAQRTGSALLELIRERE